MNRKKVKEMIQFSFYKDIQNKWFLAFNIISLISIVLMLNWSSIVGVFTGEDDTEKFNFAILDNAQLVYSDIVSQLQENDELIISQIYENTYTEENIPDDLAVVEIIPDEQEMFKVSIISKEGINSSFYDSMLDALKEARNNLFQSRYSVSDENLALFQSDITVERIMLSVNAEDSDIKEIIKLFTSALTYLLTILIFSKMANEITQEKQAKSSEYILTTVSAKEYLFAKIFSNISILLTQGLFLIIYYTIAVSISSIINISMTDISLSASSINLSGSIDVISYILAITAYNVLNLILLCIIQATLSAKTSSASEAGNTVSLLTFATMGIYIVTLYLINPYNKINLFLSILSCLPIFSAYFIPALMVVGQVTTWQIIVSFALLIVSIPIAFRFCSAIFKNGILDYKKKKNNATEKNNEVSFFTKRSMKHIGFVFGLGIILYISLQMLLSVILNFVLPPLLSSFNLNETDIMLIMQIIVSLVSLGVSYAVVNSYAEKGKLESENVSFKSKAKLVLIALFFIFSLQFLLSYLLYPTIGLDYNLTDMFSIDSTSPILSKIILVVALAIVPAIFEELFFRKALINFALPYGKVFALLSSAFLFGLLHMNLSQGLFAFLVGLILGIIYLYTKDIKVSIVIHFINNGLAAVELILPEAGQLILVALLIFTLIVGFILFIKMLVKKSSRQKFIKLCKMPVSTGSIQTRYKYIFTDFTFDVAIAAVFLMSIMTENILR